MQKVIPFSDLAQADLVVDAVYEGGAAGNFSDDPLGRLLGVGNQGGFRFVGSLEAVRLCALYSDLSQPDWPDALYPETGQFVYYGDNRHPGQELHDTPRKGNLLLRQFFEHLHNGDRVRIPPIFVFTKGAVGRNVLFRGLAVPGAAGVGQTEDLVAVWKTTSGQRFQNYRALFTILNEGRVDRMWIDAVRGGGDPRDGAPKSWLRWLDSGSYSPLAAPRTLDYREPTAQLPDDPSRIKLLNVIVDYFKAHPEREYAFEKCAVDVVRRMDRNVTAVDLTRPWRDGGRDAVGKYRIGTADSSVEVDFALEAKCKKPSSTNSSGVKETSRLISRLRYRQFGIFVTTSCVGRQAYKEIVEDGHPVLILSGADIMDVLFASNISTTGKVKKWLADTAPVKGK